MQFACSNDGTSGTLWTLSHAWAPVFDQPYDLGHDRSGDMVRPYIDGAKGASGTKAGALHSSRDGLVIGAGR